MLPTSKDSLEIFSDFQYYEDKIRRATSVAL